MSDSPSPRFRSSDPRFEDPPPEELVPPGGLEPRQYLDDDRGWPQSPVPRDRLWLHALLFVLVGVTTTVAGGEYYAGYVTDLGSRTYDGSIWTYILGGLWFSVPTLLILTCHEMGHYVAARLYGVRTSLPYFLPLPSVIPVPGLGLVGIGLFGTLGAVIRIREPLRFKRQVFDIGIAGPLAGVAIAVPAMVLSIAASRLVRYTPSGGAIYFGEPLLMRLIESWFFTPRAGYELNMHPAGFAAWFGLFLTGLNLIPVGQLDGGHVAYACLGRHARWLTWLSIGTAAVLAVAVSPTWFFWLGLIGLMLRLFGFRHPPVLDEEAPLGAARWALALLAIVIFALCFIPDPIHN